MRIAFAVSMLLRQRIVPNDRRQVVYDGDIGIAGRFGSVRDVSIEGPQIGDIIRQLYEGAARPQVPIINTPLAYTGTDVTRRPDLSETES